MHPIKVFLVDDEKMILDGLTQLYDWEANGYQLVGYATDGMNAVNLALHVRPDIVLLDINIPLKNGLDVLTELKNRLPSTKFIIISGYNDYEYLRAALRLHAFDYLLKPIHTDILAATLQHCREELFSGNYSSPSFESYDNTSLYQQMLQYLDLHFREKISLALIAEHFNMNPDYISSYFKKKSGMNLTAYINSKRIAEAKKLLHSTDLSISAISELVGFNDYRYFNKTFRNYLHITPSQYRAEHQT